MARPTCTFQRGETISIALDATSGDMSSVSAISAHLRKLAPGKTELAANAAVAATFSITTREASGGIPAGWTLTIDAATSAALSAGNYLADARLTIAGGVVTTDPILVIIKEPATL